jgi:hypothetical protein
MGGRWLWSSFEGENLRVKWKVKEKKEAEGEEV